MGVKVENTGVIYRNLKPGTNELEKTAITLIYNKPIDSKEKVFELMASLYELGEGYFVSDLEIEVLFKNKKDLKRSNLGVRFFGDTFISPYGYNTFIFPNGFRVDFKIDKTNEECESSNS